MLKKEMRLFGTKEVIFDEAIKLIAELGFEAVNMRQIATNSGIRAPSIYNHFDSKQKILDCIYDYYEYHFFDNKKTDEEMQHLIETATTRQIIDALSFTFEDKDSNKYRRMVLITKIIYVRNSLDKRARQLFLDMMTDYTEEYVKTMLDHGIDIGRFDYFDTRTFAAIFNASRQMMGIKAFNRENYTICQLSEEENVKEMLSAIIPLK